MQHLLVMSQPVPPAAVIVELFSVVGLREDPNEKNNLVGAGLPIETEMIDHLSRGTERARK